MLRHVSEKSTDTILPGFVWAAILLVTVGVVISLVDVGVVSIVQLFGAKMETRSEGILHKCIPS